MDQANKQIMCNWTRLISFGYLELVVILLGLVLQILDPVV